jgi:hypothetical protein
VSVADGNARKTTDHVTAREFGHGAPPIIFGNVFVEPEAT